mmetsp:Transcript_23492/g.31483  ORF Transcript_23492/g.31483 Transcript_23492/m.31483 type:complete len:112 (-) Transcript_23492:2021-2356(-)
MTRHHKQQLVESEANLAEVRLRHHENRRKITVLKLYDYMCIMSSVMQQPGVSPMVNKNNASTNGIVALTQKSNRSKMSPIKADKQFMAFEQSRMSKDETRNNFSNIIGNLP